MNLDWIKTRAITSPEKVAVIDPLKHTEFTYQDLNQRAEILARHLEEDAGVKKGDRIATFAPNDIAIIDMLLAAIKIGAVFVPLNWRLKPVEIARVVEDAGVEYILYATNHLDRLSEVPDAYIKYNVDEAEYNQMMDLSNHQPFESVSIDWQDPILLIYTSGSTGRPKGVIHTHESYLNNVFNQIISWRMSEDWVTIGSTPMFHILGFIDIAIPMLVVGGQLVLERYFNYETINDWIRTYKPNVLVMIPTMYYGIIASPDFKPENLMSVDLLVAGGSPPLPAVQKVFQQMGKIIINAYGLTEAPLLTFNTSQRANERPTTIGSPLLFDEMIVVDDEMHPLPQGEIGELLLKGKNVTPGYWKLPEENAKAFHDGYFRTGDLAYLNEYGEMTLVNRLKELIITGGENVLPSEVEAVLSQHPLVKSAIVLGFEHPKFGESVSAAIMVNKDVEGADKFQEVLDQFCLEKLAGYKTPKLYMEIDEIPVNSVGKPDRIELSRMMAAHAKENLTASAGS